MTVLFWSKEIDTIHLKKASAETLAYYDQRTKNIEKNQELKVNPSDNPSWPTVQGEFTNW
jgi:hypothetical protein